MAQPDLKSRVIDTPRSSGEADGNEKGLLKLVQERFVQAIENNSDASWKSLQDTLLELHDLRHVLHGRPEVEHYLARILGLLDRQPNEPATSAMLETLQQVFPAEIARLSASKQPLPPPPVLNASTKTTTSSSPRVRRFQKRVQRQDEDPDKPLFQLPELSDSTYAPVPEPLTVRRLQASIADVIAETCLRESTLAKPSGATWRAAAADFTIFEPTGEKLLEKIQEVIDEVDAAEEADTSDAASTDSSVKTPVPAQPRPPHRPPRFARDAIGHFVRCYHLGEPVVAYYNPALPASAPEPDAYHLELVPKRRANASLHFVFCPFGVLRVCPGDASEAMSLVEWHREAVLHSAMRQIPFCRLFRRMRVFRAWRAWTLRRRFESRRRTLADNLLAAVPAYGRSMLQVATLLQQVNELSVLPGRPSVASCLTLRQLQDLVDKRKLQADRILEKFYKFLKQIIVETSAVLFKRMEFYQKQVHQKQLLSKESLYNQRIRAEEQARDLATARRQLGQLGSFIRYLDLFVGSAFLRLAVDNVAKFVDEVLLVGATASKTKSVKPNDAEDPVNVTATFKADLSVNNDQLCSNPSLDEFCQFILATVADTPKLLQLHAFPMDGCITDAHLHRLPALGPATTSSATVTAAGDMPKLQPPQRLNSGLSAEQRDQRSTEVIRQPPPQNPRDLTVEGRAIVGTDQPIEFGHIWLQLGGIVRYQHYLNLCQNAFDSANEDVNRFFEESNWLVAIHTFCRDWRSDSVQKYKDQPAFSIEQTLVQLRQWTESVRTFDSNFVSSNGVALINCQLLIDSLVPMLERAYAELGDFATVEMSRLANEFVAELVDLQRHLSNREVTSANFAVYSSKLQQLKDNTQRYQQRADYIKSLFEMVRMAYRPLTAEEEKLEEEAQSQWHYMLQLMQDSSDFQNKQLPTIIRKMNDEYEALMAEARLIAKDLGENYCQVSPTPDKVVKEIVQKRTRICDIETLVKQLSETKQAIVGENYPLDELKLLVASSDMRLELWKYFSVAVNFIADWKKQLFKKFDARQALDKITEWQNAAVHIRKFLNPDDPVLARLLQLLQDFKQSLPLLAKLQSPALKERHWRSLYVGFGSDFDPNREPRLVELLAFDLPAHGKLINSVCAAALAEYQLEKTLARLNKLWLDKELKMVRHVTESVIADGERAELRNAAKRLQPAAARKTSQLEKMRSSKAVANESAVNGSTVVSNAHREVFVVADWQEILHLLQDSLLTLQSMRAPAKATEFYAELLQLDERLTAAEAAFEQLLKAQRRWQFLEKFFQRAAVASRLPRQTDAFRPLNERFVELTRLLASTPKVGQLADAARRAKLTDLALKLKKLAASLRPLVDQARRQLPRLNFFSDEEVMELLALSREPGAMLSHVRRAFPGVRQLQLALPAGGAITGTRLDYQLNADKLLLSGLVGECGERVAFSPIAASPHPVRWLALAEARLKDSNSRLLRDAVRTRLRMAEPDAPAVAEALEELTALEKAESDVGDSSEAGSILHHWLLRHPASCVLAADRILFTRLVAVILRAGRAAEDLPGRQRVLQRRQQRYCDLLRENFKRVFANDRRRRLHALLHSLILACQEQVNILQTLIACGPSCNDRNFDWVRLAKHEMPVEALPKLRRSEQPDGEQVDDLRLRRCRTSLQQELLLGRYTVSQLGHQLSYDYEFVPCHRRLVISGVTERALCHLSLALANYQIGCLAGDATAGKSETVRELGCLLGRLSISLNCGADLCPSSIRRHLTGALACGAILVMEELGRLPAPLVAAFAQDAAQIGRLLKGADPAGAAKSSEEQTATRREQRRRRRRSGSIGEDPSMTGDQGDCIGEQGRRRKRRNSADDGSAGIATGSGVVDGGIDSDAYRPVRLSGVCFAGCLLSPKDTFGCLATLGSGGERHGTAAAAVPVAELPDCLRRQLRPCSLLGQDWQPIIEQEMLCLGFTKLRPLIRKVLYLAEQLRTHLEPEFRVSLRAVLNCLQLAAIRLNLPSQEDQAALDQNNRLSCEEAALVRGFSCFVIPQLRRRDTVELYRGLLRNVFPLSARPQANSQTHDPELVTCLQEQLAAAGLQATQAQLGKMLQLHGFLVGESARPAVLTGAAGTGKSASLSVLAAALTSLVERRAAESEQEDAADAVRRTRPGRNLGMLDSLPVRPASSGAFKMWQQVISAAALEQMYIEVTADSDNASRYRRVSQQRIFCDALTPPELEKLTQRLLARANRRQEASESFADNFDAKRYKGLAKPSTTDTWLVFDGQLGGQLGEALIAAAAAKSGTEATLKLNDGSSLSVSQRTRIAVETDRLDGMSPGMLARCGVIYFGEDVVGRESLWRSWLHRAKHRYALTSGGAAVLEDLTDALLPPLVSFASSRQVRFALPGCRAFHCVSAFLRVLDALMSRYFTQEDWTLPTTSDSPPVRSGDCSGPHSLPPSWTSIDTNLPLYYALLRAFHLYALAWGFGGCLTSEQCPEFDSIIRDAVKTGGEKTSSVELPDCGLFECFVDMKTGSLLRWSEKYMEKARPKDSFWRTPDTESCHHVARLLLQSGRSVSLWGASGCGKTSFVEFYFNKQPLAARRIAVSPRLSSRQMEASIDAAHSELLSKRRPQKQRKLLLFLDDLHRGGSCSELARCIVDCGGHFARGDDADDGEFRELSEVQLLTAVSAAPPGSKQMLSSRLLHQMQPVRLDTAKKAALTGVFVKRVSAWMAEFPAYALPHEEFLANIMAQALHQLYIRVQRELPATPACPLNAFSVHNFYQVLQGLLMFEPKAAFRSGGGASESGKSKSDASNATALVTKLFFHEICRTFEDRLSSQRDVAWFGSTLYDLFNEFFCTERKPPTPTPSKSLTPRSEAAADAAERTGERGVAFQETEKNTESVAKDDDNLGEKKKTDGNEEVDDDDDNDDEEDDSEDETMSAIESTASRSSRSAASRRGSTSSLTSGGVSGVGRSGRRGVAQSPFFGPLFDNDSAATLEEPEAGVAGSANNTEAAASRRELFDLTGQLFVRFGVLAAGSPSPPGGGAAANVYTECNSSELSAAAASAVSTASGSRRHRQKAASRSKGERDEHDSDVTAAVDPDLVLLESGLRHLARLTRCLALPTGGHAILASATPGVGRSTLTRLAARMSRCRFLEASAAAGDLLARLREASSVAQTQPVCLLISSAALAASGGSDAIDVVVATMRDGACPGLFDVATDSSSEAKSKATAAASTQPAFQLAVRSNLRCVLSLNWRDSKLGSLHSVLSRHPELLHACQCIDWYSDWSQDTYAAVARHWLESGAFDLSLTTATSAKTESIVAATAQAAAAAHVTAGRMLSGLYAGLSPESPMLPTQATPLAFKEFLSLATGLAGDLRRAAIRDIEAGSSLADSISAEQATLDAQKLEAEAARPKLEAQLWDVEMQAQAIQQQREKYKAQLDACREQEAKVKQLLEPLEKMKKESQDSGQAKLDPVYEAAIRAAESLQPQHLEEVRSYREPPEPVKAVMSVICMLFDTETESWEAAKELMMKEDLQELLLYYDKASMPDSKFKRLTAALSRPEMSEMAVSSASKAAAKVRDWLEAVQQFTAVSRDLNPAIGALRAAEERVSREQTRLGRMRVEAQKQLESLNAAIGLHREASLAARQLRQRIARMQAEVERGAQLMQRLDRRWHQWRQQRERGEARSATALGDAFLAAAVATYEVGLPPDAAPQYRTFLLDLLAGCSDWLPCQPGQPDVAELLLADDCDSRQLADWRSRLAAELGDVDNQAATSTTQRCIESLAALRARLRHRNLSRWSLVHCEFFDGVGTGDTPMRRLLDLVFPRRRRSEPPVAGEASEATKPARSDRPARVRFQEQPSGQSSRDSFDSGDDGDDVEDEASADEDPRVLSADDPNLEASLLDAAQCGAAVLLVNFERRRRRRVRASPALLDLLDGCCRRHGRRLRSRRNCRGGGFQLVVCTSAAFLEESATLAGAADAEDGGDADCELAQFHHADLGWTERQLSDALSAAAADAEAPELRGQLSTLRADGAKAEARLADLASQAASRIVEAAAGAASTDDGAAPRARLINDDRLGEFFDWLNLETERCEKQLGETLQLASGLSNRLDEFSTFGAALLPLWKAAKSTRWLSPLYSFGFSQLMDCVREGLRQRQGGGGSQQSARVKDLTDSCIRATLTELSSRLGEAHFDALMLAFALERLLARGQVRPEQAALLLGRRDAELPAACDDEPSSDRPAWVPERSEPPVQTKLSGPAGQSPPIREAVAGVPWPASRVGGQSAWFEPAERCRKMPALETAQARGFLIRSPGTGKPRARRPATSPPTVQHPATP
ncbi:hypothetical protein BOX15_Mlig022241g1 [Macrostomum lignano]|uniref:AAA+ ATPase domain-containing protein n=1 Tax=Macrostomum lignano TaxID=282301 RepID=A0A267GRI1_9PLAT|nr:hypothetical protein BOX15_Mlig022241g1 [Macrostomum lignano]